MASQAQLEADIALARAQVASLERQLDAASGSPQPDPAVIADIERQLATAKNTLIRLQNELNNLLVVLGEGGLTSTPPPSSPKKSATGYTNYRALYPEAQSDPFDELGNLNPGWTVDELGNPAYVGFGKSTAPASGSGVALSNTQSTATEQDAKSFEKAKDWRVRLSLAPNAKYLYKTDAQSGPGILGPLAATNGVIFPYTPTVSVVYAAAYEPSELIHSNYKIYNYKNSNVDTVTITGDFTAQDTNEANYLLAVIHFFKSVTKMFYGQDQNPRNGTPPPLVYMSGLGTFQFDNHPLAVTNFTYSLPNEVDYIRAGSVTTQPGSSTAGQTPVNNTDNASNARIQSSNLGPRTPNFQRQQATINNNATYVPTKMQIVITCIPIVTRNDISNNFSLRDYSTGALLQGSKRNGGGIW